jgi:hypothetical protein
VTTDSAPTPARSRMHVVMVVDKDVVIDSRVRKEAASLADAATGSRWLASRLAGCRPRSVSVMR